MFYATRVFQVGRVETLEELAEKLCTHTWTLCQAWEFGDLILANNSSSENGTQEYAVIRGDVQLDSLTVSWMTQEKFIACMQRLLTADDREPFGHATLHTNHPKGACRHCA